LYSGLSVVHAPYVKGREWQFVRSVEQPVGSRQVERKSVASATESVAYLAHAALGARSVSNVQVDDQHDLALFKTSDMWP
jgi:uncharacterized protein (DUF1810 family)